MRLRAWNVASEPRLGLSVLLQGLVQIVSPFDFEGGALNVASCLYEPRQSYFTDILCAVRPLQPPNGGGCNVITRFSHWYQGWDSGDCCCTEFCVGLQHAGVRKQSR